MGVVYRARDLHLERDVAIKLLPAGSFDDEEARRRFRREALALSKLNHPNIGVVHDFDTQDGVDFLVMELVPGRPLSERIAQGPMAESELRAVGAQIADALAAAHALGIVHRDVKPPNVLITPDGRAKVVDFGIARTAHPAGGESATTLTTTAAIAGTPPYMAPEQLRGEAVDARTDVYALGVVLFEMSTGRRPFASEQTAILLNAILNEPPPAPRKLRPDLPPQLEQVMLRCLEKNPGQRIQTSAELATRLRGEGGALRPKRGEPRAVTVPMFVLAVSTLAIITALALIGANVGGLRDRLPGAASGHMRSIAVLPLENYSGDPNQLYFADGMTDELITTLAQIDGVRVISRSSVMQYRGTRTPLDRIARQLNVTDFVEGSVARGGGRLRVTAQLVDAASGQSLWAGNFERDEHDVLAMQDEMALQIAHEVRARLSMGERERMGRHRRVDPVAHDQYLRGLYHLNLNTSSEGRQAVELFERSIAADSTYARAWAGLASAYCSLSTDWLAAHEAMGRARATALKALQLDPNLSEAHAALAYVLGFYDWKRDDAKREIRRAIELNPNNSLAHVWYGYLLDEERRFKESRRELAQAIALDPLSRLNFAFGLLPTYGERRFDEMERRTRSALEVDSTNAYARFYLGVALAYQGHYTEGLDQLYRTMAYIDFPQMWGFIGNVQARSGQTAEARQTLAKLTEMARTEQVPAYSRAVIYTALGERDSALTWLERGLPTHDEYLGYLDVDPALDPLRGDPRFEEIRRVVGLAR